MEFSSQLKKKLTRLTQDKLNETDAILPGIGSSDKKEKKCNEKSSKVIDLKTLMKELDIIYNVYNNRMITKVPVYGDLLDIEKRRNSSFSWWKPICTLMKMMDYPLQLTTPAPYKTDKDIVDILQDFSMSEHSRKNAYDEWKKAGKKEAATKMKKKLNPRASSAAKKMAERRERRKFALKEYEVDGEKHFLVVRKKVVPNEDAVEIFSDWKDNLYKKKTESRRKRKISHRAMRKDMIKSALAQPARPTSYAQAVRKNLKLQQTEQPAIEDVFQTFARLVESLSAVVEHSKASKTDIDMLDYFHPFRHNFHIPQEQQDQLDIFSSTEFMSKFECAQPTVSLVTPKKIMVTQKKVSQVDMRRAKCNTQKTNSVTFTNKDRPMPKWQNNVSQVKETSKPTVQDYKVESYFSEWIPHLEEPKPHRQLNRAKNQKTVKTASSSEEQNLGTP